MSNLRSKANIPMRMVSSTTADKENSPVEVDRLKKLMRVGDAPKPVISAKPQTRSQTVTTKNTNPVMVALKNGTTIKISPGNTITKAKNNEATSAAPKDKKTSVVQATQDAKKTRSTKTAPAMPKPASKPKAAPMENKMTNLKKDILLNKNNNEPVRKVDSRERITKKIEAKDEGEKDLKNQKLGMVLRSKKTVTFQK